MLTTALWLLLTASPVTEVALLSTSPQIDVPEVTELRFQPVGATEPAPVAARFTHVPSSTVLGAVIPGTRRVLINVTTSPARDPSWASSLVLLEEGKEPIILAEQVAVSTRPLISAEGRVFVQRGVAGQDVEGFGRVDEITVDEVNLRTRAIRPVLRFSGMTAFLAGSVGRELLVYRVGVKGADLVAVHVDTLAVRPLISELVPLARDFVVDGGRLIYTQGNPQTGAWSVEAVSLTTLKREVLFKGARSMALLPTPLPGGLAVADGSGRGLINAASGENALRSQGDGFERVRMVLNGVAIGLHETPSEFSKPLAVELKSGEPLRLVAPAGARLDVAGAVLK